MADLPVMGREAPAQPTPLPQRDPSSFGAGIAEGLGELGDALHGMATARQSSDYAIADAQRGTQMGQIYAIAQADPQYRSGDGFRDVIGQQFDQLYANAELPRDPALRERARVQMAQDRARWLDQAQTYEIQARGAAVADNTGQALDLYSNDLSQSAPIDTAGALQAFTGALSKIDTTVSGAAGLHPQAALALRRKGEQDAGAALVNGLVDRGALDTARSLVDRGAFNGTSSPEQVQAFRQRIDVEQRRLDAQARATQALGKAQAEQAIAIINSKIGDGVQVPDSDLVNAAAIATHYKLFDKAYNLNVARERQGVNLETLSWTPQQYQDEINHLAAKGPNASEQEQVRLNQLQAIVEKRTAEFHDNPGGYAAANGAPAPAIDQGTDIQLQARAAWRRSVQQATGAWTPTLSKEEAAPWLEKVQHGTPADRLETAQYIGAWGDEAPNVLRQIDPNRDSPFSQAVALGSTSAANMRDALAGPDALKALGGDDRAFHVDPNNAQQHDAQGNALTPQFLFARDAGRALMARGGPYAAAVLENARYIYASTAQRSGWTIYHPGEMEVSIRRSLSGRHMGDTWVGSLGTHNGESFQLPTTMTQQSFDHVFSRADGKTLIKASNGEPVFSDGRTLHAAELKALIPVAVGDGRYAFRSATGNGYIQVKGQHRPYVLDVTQLPR